MRTPMHNTKSFTLYTSKKVIILLIVWWTWHEIHTSRTVMAENHSEFCMLLGPQAPASTPKLRRRCWRYPSPPKSKVYRSVATAIGTTKRCSESQPLACSVSYTGVFELSVSASTYSMMSSHVHGWKYNGSWPIQSPEDTAKTHTHKQALCLP